MARLLGIDVMYYTSHTLHTYTCVVLLDVWTYVSTHVLLHGVRGVLYRHTMCSIQSLPLLFIVAGCLQLLTSNIILQAGQYGEAELCCTPVADVFDVEG